MCFGVYFFMDKIEIVKFPTGAFGIRVTFNDDKDYPFLYSFSQNELSQDTRIDGYQAIPNEFKCKDYNFVKNVVKEFGVNTDIKDIEIYKDTDLPF